MRGACLRRPDQTFWGYVGFVLVALYFLAGVGFLLSLTDDARGRSIATFNAASSAWPPIAATFSGLTANVTGDAGVPGGFLPLLASSVAPSYPDTAGLNIPTVNLFYTGSGPLTSGRKYNKGETTTFLFNVDGVLSSVSPALFTEGTSSVYSKGSDGKDSTTTVVTYNCLSGLCVTANAARAVVGGCSPEGGQTTYKSCDPNAFHNFALTMDLRSESDPFVVALRLTGGKLDFGITQQIKIIVGCVLAGFFGALFAACCVRVRYTLRPAPTSANDVITSSTSQDVGNEDNLHLKTEASLPLETGKATRKGTLGSAQGKHGNGGVFG